MKSSEKQLVARGMIPKEADLEFVSYSFSDLLLMLKCKVAFERSIGARLLGVSGNPKAVDHLCKALMHEKKLYTKIEICNALSLLGTYSVTALISLLGVIGSNQHRVIPDKKFGKNSYPLPRDIAGRILIRIGIPALPALKEVLINGNEKQISEALDAIGHICYSFNYHTCYQIIMDCYLKFQNNNLIVWKAIRAMGAFPEFVGFLNNLLAINAHPGIRSEIERSLEVMAKRFT